MYDVFPTDYSLLAIPYLLSPSFIQFRLRMPCTMRASVDVKFARQIDLQAPKDSEIFDPLGEVSPGPVCALTTPTPHYGEIRNICYQNKLPREHRNWQSSTGSAQMAFASHCTDQVK